MADCFDRTEIRSRACAGRVCLSNAASGIGRSPSRQFDLRGVAAGRGALRLLAGSIGLQSVAMQVRAVHVEPGLGALHVRTDATQDAPEPRRMVHFDEMGDLMGGQIVEHIARGQNQPPRKRQHTGRRARPPAARLVANRDAAKADAEFPGKMPDGDLEVALGLALEIIGDAARDVFGLAGDAQQAFAAAVALGPYRAARAAAVHDRMGDAPQRQFRAVREWRGLRQPAEAGGDPGAMLLGKFARLTQAAARRHGEHRLARHRDDAQRVTPRLAMAAQPNEIDGVFANDFDRRRLGGTTIEQRACGHWESIRANR